MRHAWLLLAIVACDIPKKQWSEIHATQLHVGALEANIPPGWRDFNELVTKPDIKLPVGARMILEEKDPRRGRVMVMPMPGAIQGDLCADAAKLWQESFGAKVTLSNAEAANFNGSKGCMMSLSGPEGTGKLMVLTPPGGSSATVICFGRDREEACDKIVYGLHATAAK